MTVIIEASKKKRGVARKSLGDVSAAENIALDLRAAAPFRPFGRDDYRLDFDEDTSETQRPSTYEIKATNANASKKNTSKSVLEMGNEDVWLHNDGINNNDYRKRAAVEVAAVDEPTTEETPKADKEAKMTNFRNQKESPHLAKAAQGTAKKDHHQEGKESSPLLPFCFKCNRPEKNRRVHHPWCPKNAHFAHSRADEVLVRLGAKKMHSVHP
jgi:hypothetical protein